MAFNCFDVTYRIARELNILREGTATGGLVTAISDTVQLQNHFPNDYFNLGGAWILNDIGGLHAAPEGQFAIVTDFDMATGTLTVAPAFTMAVAAGDRYAVTPSTYPMDKIASEMNKVLAEIPVPTTDIVSLTTAAITTEYTLPAAMLGDDIEVWIQHNTGAVNDNLWKKVHDWYIQQTVTGSAKRLIFRDYPDYPFLLKLVYYLPHPPLYAATDRLNENVDINRVVLEAAYRLLVNFVSQPTNSNPQVEKMITEIAPRLDKVRWLHPHKKDNVKLNTLGNVDDLSLE